MSREPIDLLVVGGGPAGTAAAFRARELALDVLVVDFDDLMKRIRDYSKEKLILPGFGGGDKMGFPEGGDLISALHFEPIDKDDLCALWKGLFREHDVTYRTGIELSGVEPLEDGTLRVLTWNHTERAEEVLLARHVIIAIGRGVPRRFDIPGNCEGVGFRLSDPELFVGEPACVVGGGTSAAEAVIAISNAKVEAADPTAVYWSYRGDRMPRVSKALADVFFEAYVGNGNIRYFPKSEPVAVVEGEDRKEYLSIRVDRRAMDNRPLETTHLEFAKERSIACIGEDVPEALLSKIGAPMMIGGPGNKKRVVVNRFHETRQPNVYLAGDLLSQAYLETDDFDADPASFREVKHRGNIKSALRDGVLAAQVVRQRLDGVSDIDLRVKESEVVVERKPSAVAIAREPKSEGPDHEAFLVRLLATGVEEEEYPLEPRGVTTIGRRDCDLAFPNDSMLSPVHASIAAGEEGYLLRDDGGESGVFLQVPPARKLELTDRDLLRAGRQFLLVAGTAEGFSVTHFDAEGKELETRAIGDKSVLVGRQAPDLTLDSGDPTLSRRHLALSVVDHRLYVKDLKSVNGTFLRVRSARQLEPGDRFRVGQQVFGFRLAGQETTRPTPTAAPTEPVAAAAEGAKSAPTVTFKGTGMPISVATGQTLCEIAEAEGVAINAECHSGICGSDPVRILSGLENLAGEAGDQERDTLEDICELQPGECRLACMVRIKGPVEVEILGPKD